VGRELDGRPIGMYRDTMECWVQECPNPECGYCAPDLEVDLPNAKECVEGTEYKATLKQEGIPPMMRRFRCAAMVQLHAQEAREAATYLIYAAWVADDAKLVEEAKMMRMMAVNLLTGSECTIIVDLLRRAGRFDQAAIAIDRYLGQSGIDSNEQRLLVFQRTLVEKKDAAAHSVREAFQS
jgi:hypothetical protein